MARPRKIKRPINANVNVVKTTNLGTPWYVQCSKHGTVSKHKYWHQAATSKVNHQAQHRG